MVKCSLLRQHFSSQYSNQELQQWFDPLTIIEEDSSCIRVILPHKYFADWFMRGPCILFEKKLLQLHKDYSITYSIFTKGAHSPQLDKENFQNNNYISIPLNVNLKQTFDTFIINKKNSFPFVTAKNIIKDYSPAPYTPLIIHGVSGSGKTHLLNAMVNYFIQSGQSKTYFYGTIEELLKETFVWDGLYNNSVFFVDNVQSMLDNSALQKRFVSFFEYICAQRILLVLCMDINPATCNGISQRLRMRLTSGLLVELKKPDLNVRLQYILRQSEKLDVAMTKETALSLAYKNYDLRSIDGTLTVLKAYRAYTQQPDTDATLILGTDTIQKILTPREITRQVAKFYSIPLEDIIGKKRTRQISYARQMALLLCRELIGLSLVQLGHFFGERNHSSILYLLNKIQELQKSNKDTNNNFQQLKKLCLTSA